MSEKEKLEKQNEAIVPTSQNEIDRQNREARERYWAGYLEDREDEEREHEKHVGELMFNLKRGWCF